MKFGAELFLMEFEGVMMMFPNAVFKIRFKRDNHETTFQSVNIVTNIARIDKYNNCTNAYD